MMSLTDLRAEFERQTAHSHFNEQVYGSMTDFDRTKRFHTVMGLQVNHEPIVPTVEERILRAKLLLEETIETIEKGLGLRIRCKAGAVGVSIDVGESLEVYHREGDFYDPIETLDGLADVKVIAEGTAVAFGLPLEEASYEVYCSNMTKLDGNGNPVVNQCKHEGPEDKYVPPFLELVTDPASLEIAICNLRWRGLPCTDDSHLVDPSKPRGKLLKSEFYVPANIARVIYESVHPDSRNRVRGVLESNRRK